MSGSVCLMIPTACSKQVSSTSNMQGSTPTAGENAQLGTINSGFGSAYTLDLSSEAQALMTSKT